MQRDPRRVGWRVAAIAFALFILLGLWVVRDGEPSLLKLWEHAWVNHSTLVAWRLSWAGDQFVLAPVAAVLLVVAWLVPTWRARILFSIAMLVLCWRGADLFQHLFGRPRRLDWVVKHERSFSYPSSHAAIATGFYALWGAMLWMSELPRPVRIGGGVLLVALALAICWSRLALGAHYLTDLVGGVLLAVTFVSAGVALVPTNVLTSGARPLRRTAE